MGVSLAGRAARAARLGGSAKCAAAAARFREWHAGRCPYSSRMFWPLLGGFVAFVLLAVLMGWLMDTDRRGDADRH